MKQRLGRYQTWLRVAFVIIASGLLYLGVQFADLSMLRSFANAAPSERAGSPRSQVETQPIAYVPVGDKPALQLYAGGSPPAEIKVSEVGDGGDLGDRARRMLDRYQPYLLAQGKDGVAYVSLAAALDYLGGELKWSEGDPQASILLPDALITFVPGQLTALRNYRPIALTAPALVENGQLRVPLKSLDSLCGVKVESSTEGNLFTLTRGERVLHVIVRERMYSMEVSRSARELYLSFLGQPIKTYPLCMGEGENTPCGHWQIVNKAEWPPWTAYWGEYMPGGSSRNPLGARWLGTSAHGRATGRVIGIHGTNQPSSIGQRISGGCMRTYSSNAIELYNNIPVGTQLYIHE